MNSWEYWGGHFSQNWIESIDSTSIPLINGDDFGTMNWPRTTFGPILNITSWINSEFGFLKFLFLLVHYTKMHQIFEYKGFLKVHFDGTPRAGGLTS